MTTRLEGAKTRFLPLKKGNDGRANNPPNPDGSPTAYLSEELLDRDSFLAILGKFLLVQTEEKTDLVTGDVSKSTSIVFPRLSPVDSVTKLIEAARVEGSGHEYPIQRSAGPAKPTRWPGPRNSSPPSTMM